MPKTKPPFPSSATKGTFRSGDADLFFRHWPARANDPAIVIVHGGGEHSGRYEDTARALVKGGFHVYAFDLRGHGQSPGRRGHIRRFREYREDIHAFVSKVAESHGKPSILAHSMGGLLATYYAVEHPDAIRCLALSSPMWGLSLPISRRRATLGRFLGIFAPWILVRRPAFGLNPLSHDLRVVAAFVRDPLVHPHVSLGLYRALDKNLRRLPKALPNLRVPLLVLQAGADMICSADATRRLFPLVGSSDKKLVIFDRFYHEVLNEVEKDRVYRDLLLWVKKTCSAP